MNLKDFVLKLLPVVTDWWTRTWSSSSGLGWSLAPLICPIQPTNVNIPDCTDVNLSRLQLSALFGRTAASARRRLSLWLLLNGALIVFVQGEITNVQKSSNLSKNCLSSRWKRIMASDLHEDGRWTKRTTLSAAASSSSFLYIALFTVLHWSSSSLLVQLPIFAIINENRWWNIFWI